MQLKAKIDKVEVKTISKDEDGLRERELHFCKLLIDGEDCDTGIYRYSPCADAAIKNFKDILRITSALKSGKNVKGLENKIFAKYCIADEMSNKKALQSAREASKKFRYTPVAMRVKMLSDIRESLINNKEKLIELLMLEGHPRKLAEWEYTGMLKGVAPETLNFYKDSLWKEVGHKDGERMYLVRKPDGVVCLAPPRNAPCSNSFTAVLVFLAGNTLVIKPPLKKPIATIYLWRDIIYPVLVKNGAPKGILNIVVGNSKVIFEEWITSDYVDDVIYFGESEQGIELGKKIYDSGKKPVLELSGNDMMFVWKDADISNAAKSLADAFLGSTQICMVPKKAFVHEKIYDEFLKHFVKEVRKVKVGLPSDPNTTLVPVAKADKFYEFLEDAISQGAKLIQGGKKINFEGIEDENGLFVQPSVLKMEGCSNLKNIKIITEENFFPLVPVIKVDCDKNFSEADKDKNIFEDMIEIANLNSYGLRTSVWIKSDLYKRKFVKYLHNSGLIRINSRHVDFSLYLATHGGTGRTGGPFGEMNYMWQKTSHLQGVSRFD